MTSTSLERTTAQDGFGSAGTPPSNTRRSAAGDRLYRIVWRWHFYAGMIITLPLIVVAATGALYIFKDEVEGVLHPGVLYVEPAVEHERRTHDGLEVVEVHARRRHPLPLAVARGVVGSSGRRSWISGCAPG